MAATTKNQLGARMAKEMINAGTRAGKRELIRPIVWPAAQRQLDDWYAGTLDAGDLPADLLLSEMSFFDDDALAVLSADRRTTVAGAAS